ncbi:MAG: class I SAM-dependent RNA methyltransferase [Gemmatimonadota bacterium]
MSYRRSVLPRSEYDTLVVTAPGLEEITRRELLALGAVAAGPLERGAIPLRASLRTLYALNLNLRTASRITVLGATFHARSFAELERRAKSVPWSEWLADGTRVQLRVASRKSKLYHTDAVAERIAGAITARSRATVTASSPDDDVREQLVLVRLLRDECTIRFDSSGDHLHRRGYRQAVAKAPLRETLAAAMLLGARWDPATPLIDPFCGSGTIPIEAALLAGNIAPGAQRDFGFMRWPNFNRKTWREVLAQAEARERAPVAETIFGFDRDKGAIEAASANAQRARIGNHVHFNCQSLSALEPPEQSGWIVTNPPYGVRIGEGSDLRDLYATLGRLARERLAAWHVALLGADAKLLGHVGARLEEIFRTTNGGLDVRLVMRVPLEQRSGRRRRAAGSSLGITEGSPE